MLNRFGLFAGRKHLDMFTYGNMEGKQELGWTLFGFLNWKVVLDQSDVCFLHFLSLKNAHQENVMISNRTKSPKNPKKTRKTANIHI